MYLFVAARDIVANLFINPLENIHQLVVAQFLLLRKHLEITIFVVYCCSRPSIVSNAKIFSQTPKSN